MYWSKIEIKSMFKFWSLPILFTVFMFGRNWQLLMCFKKRHCLSYHVIIVLLDRMWWLAEIWHVFYKRISWVPKFQINLESIMQKWQHFTIFHSFQRVVKCTWQMSCQKFKNFWNASKCYMSGEEQALMKLHVEMFKLLDFHMEFILTWSGWSD